MANSKENIFYLGDKQTIIIKDHFGYEIARITADEENGNIVE